MFLIRSESQSRPIRRACSAIGTAKTTSDVFSIYFAGSGTTGHAVYEPQTRGWRASVNSSCAKLATTLTRFSCPAVE